MRGAPWCAAVRYDGAQLRGLSPQAAHLNAAPEAATMEGLLPLRRVSELASGHTGNVVPRKGLRVRVSCPPPQKPRQSSGFLLFALSAIAPTQRPVLATLQKKSAPTFGSNYGTCSLAKRTTRN